VRIARLCATPEIPKQVKRAGRIEKDRAGRFRELLTAVLGLPAGRALLWELLGRAKVNASVFHRDQAVMAYSSGRQDFGHELLAEIIAADSTLYLQMEREARDRDKRDDATVDAAHIPSADKQERSSESS
jgi:hypothetical protein